MAFGKPPSCPKHKCSMCKKGKVPRHDMFYNTCFRPLHVCSQCSIKIVENPTLCPRHEGNIPDECKGCDLAKHSYKAGNLGKKRPLPKHKREVVSLTDLCVITIKKDPELMLKAALVGRGLDDSVWVKLAEPEWFLPPQEKKQRLESTWSPRLYAVGKVFSLYYTDKYSSEKMQEVRKFEQRKLLE